jgi:hypothetical protein
MSATSEIDAPSTVTGQNLRPQTLAFTRRTGDFPQIVREALFRPLAVCFVKLAFDVGNNALKAAGVLHVSTKPVAVAHYQFEVIPPQYGLLDALRQLIPGGVKVEVKFLRQAC